MLEFLKYDNLTSNRIVKISGVACIIACVGDFAVMFILGSYFTGYSQMKNTMSSLGASISPVSDQMSAWWIVAGLLFIFYGIGVYFAFRSQGKASATASWLIAVYGAGEGIGSGAFKANHHLGGVLTSSAVIHDVLGGIGIVAILVLPLVMKKVIADAEFPFFHKVSNVVFIMGIFFLILFSFRISNDKSNFLSSYQGLWQRLMMLNSYIYLIAIAFFMFRKPARAA